MARAGGRQPTGAGQTESAKAAGHEIAGIRLRLRSRTLADDNLAGVLTLAHEAECVFGPFDWVRAMRQGRQQAGFDVDPQTSQHVPHEQRLLCGHLTEVKGMVGDARERLRDAGGVPDAGLADLDETSAAAQQPPCDRCMTSTPSPSRRFRTASGERYSPSGHDRERAFFHGWTRKEAFVKALGDGLSYPLDSFSVSLRPGPPPRLEDIDGDADTAPAWTILDSSRRRATPRRSRSRANARDFLSTLDGPGAGRA